MKKTFMILPILIFFISCAKTKAYIETCEDVNCSENAYCEVIDDVPTCFCNEGFEGNGIICNENKNYTWKISIGGNKTSNARVVTHDEENNIYIAGEFSGVIDFDPGEGRDVFISGFECKPETDECSPSCGNNEICNYDTLQCECKTGYHYEEIPDDTGVIIYECQKDICDTPCKETEICSNNKCICKKGYHLNENLKCVEDFKCTQTCAENEYCNNGTCECKHGWYKVYNLNSFITKLKEDGSYIWTKVLYSKQKNYIKDMVVKDKKIYALGAYTGDIDLDPGDSVDFKKAAPEEGSFILKMTDTGSYIDSTTFAANQPFSILVTDNDKIYVAGGFKGRVDFSSFYISSTLKSVDDSIDAFLAKFKTDLEFLWAFQIGGSNWDGIVSMVTDSDGNIYAVGAFDNIVDFNPKEPEDLHTGNGFSDMFISKFTASGNYLWTKTYGGTNFDNLEDIVIDNDGNLIIAGNFSDTLIIDEEHQYDSNGFVDIFVSKLDKDGNFLWTKTFGGPQWDIGGRLAVDSENNIYVSASFMDFIEFEDGIKRESLGSYDSFVVKLDKDGKYLWGRTIGGNEDEYVSSLDTDNKDNLLITGEYRDNIILETTTDEFKTQGESALYLFKIK